MPGLDRKRRITTLMVAVAVLIVTPLAVVASHQFNDVPDSNIFHDDIEWLADNDVTRGCNPPANDEFCPSDNVTRQQMAAFMHRLAVNEVVNAATANEADHAATADNATTAASADDADTLDGGDSSQYTTVLFGDGSTASVPLAGSEVVLAEAQTTLGIDGHAVLSYSLWAESPATGFDDVESWLQLNDSVCLFGAESTVPGSFSQMTVAEDGVEPLLNSGGATAIVPLSEGTSTVTLCALGGSATLFDASVTGVFSPTGSGSVTVAGSAASTSDNRR